MQLQVNNETLHREFQESSRPHVLMITNHGMHEWDVTPGLPDTGGQNVFVNQFTDSLIDQGYRVTVINRGGYAHPETGFMHKGLIYKHGNARILYIEDSVKAFVRKEDMHEHLPELKAFLVEALESEATAIDMILSHYWDGARLGVMYNETLPRPVPHIWTPHSLGMLKKRNIGEEHWERLRIDERIAVEKEVLPKLDGVVATSAAIQRSLEADYDYHTSLFLPPCVNPNRFYPHEVGEDAEVWSFLARYSGLSESDIRQRRIITEISRTVRTKRKDVLIRAFAQVAARNPNVLLVVNLDENRTDLTDELEGLVASLGLKGKVALVEGEVEDTVLPDLYAGTSIYVTPSVMEGFGMAVQEAAASGTPVISSDLVPFVVEHLVGEDQTHWGDAQGSFREGPGGIIVPADQVEGFARAMEYLLRDDERRKRMGREAYRITIPSFTWENRVKDFLEWMPISS